MFAARDARLIQPPSGLDCAAGLAVRQMDGGCAKAAWRWPGVGLVTPGRQAVAPVVKATAGDLEHPVHGGRAELPERFTHEGVLHGSSLAKYAAAFFRMSRSSVTFQFTLVCSLLFTEFSVPLFVCLLSLDLI